MRESALQHHSGLEKISLPPQLDITLRPIESQPYKYPTNNLNQTSASRGVAHESEELFASLLLAAEDAQHATGDCLGMLFFYAAHHHAQVPGFNDNAHALRTEFLHQRHGYLIGQAFLNLQPSCENVNEARNLA